MKHLYYLLGLYLGDGNLQGKHILRISTSSTFHAKVIEQYLQKLLIPFKTLREASGMIRIKFKNKKFLTLLEAFNAKTKRKTESFTLDFIDNLEFEEKVFLISGLFDAEGWIENDKGSLRIRFKLKNQKVRDKLVETLRELGFEISKFDRKDGSYGLTIQKRKSFERFWKTFDCPYLKYKLLHLLAEAPNALGYTRHTTGATMGCDPERGSKSPKSAPSSDRGLQLALVKPESLVGERHQRSPNTSLLLAHTARQANRVESQ